MLSLISRLLGRNRASEGSATWSAGMPACSTYATPAEGCSINAKQLADLSISDMYILLEQNLRVFLIEKGRPTSNESVLETIIEQANNAVVDWLTLGGCRPILEKRGHGKLRISPALDYSQDQGHSPIGEDRAISDMARSLLDYFIIANFDLRAPDNKRVMENFLGRECASQCGKDVTSQKLTQAMTDAFYEQTTRALMAAEAQTCLCDTPIIDQTTKDLIRSLTFSACVEHGCVIQVATNRFYANFINLNEYENASSCTNNLAVSIGYEARYASAYAKWLCDSNTVQHIHSIYKDKAGHVEAAKQADIHQQAQALATELRMQTSDELASIANDDLKLNYPGFTDEHFAHCLKTQRIMDAIQCIVGHVETGSLPLRICETMQNIRETIAALSGLMDDRQPIEAYGTTIWQRIHIMVVSRLLWGLDKVFNTNHSTTFINNRINLLQEPAMREILAEAACELMLAQYNNMPDEPNHSEQITAHHSADAPQATSLTATNSAAAQPPRPLLQQATSQHPSLMVNNKQRPSIPSSHIALGMQIW